MLAGKTANSMEGHVERIAAHGNGHRHLDIAGQRRRTCTTVHGEQLHPAKKSYS